jgi:ActR/RegA family two-component response regulator
MEDEVERAIQVLVVDDEERFADNLCRLLKARGFGAQAAYDGSRALRVAGETPPDAVVLDMKMPGMDGLETLRELKKGNEDLEVIMLTGHADVETGIQAIREGAFDYLFKPCDIDILAERIREAVAAEEIKRHPVLWPRRVVKEITNAGFIRLDTEDDLKKALDIFNAIGRAGVREELHVTDGHGRLRGVISKKDLIREARRMNPGMDVQWEDLAVHRQWLPEKRVSEVMRKPPELYSRPDEKLSRVAEKMIQNNLRCLPVIEDGRFVGIIRFRDILHYVSDVLVGDGGPGEGDDAESE